MKSKIIKIAGLSAMLFCVLTLTCAVVHADELDGYTRVDWSWNRDIETDKDNSILVGNDIVFWRYVNAANPQNSAIWKSAFGDELTDDDIRRIWWESSNVNDKYIHMSADVNNISNEEIKNYIYEHVNESVPDLKLKFDIGMDFGSPERNNNQDKAKKLFNSDIGYRIFRDSEGVCRIEFIFSPQFHLSAEPIASERGHLPYMPHVYNNYLPRTMYPFSSVLFSMWGAEAGSNEHFGALEVIEGDDPRYIYGQSFGYGDILEKGRLPENMIYPNYEAGKVNEEGSTAGQIEADTLDSNLVRIGQQYKRSGDLWYYSYGGAVGYLFKFPIRVSFALEEQAKITRRYINTLTSETVFTDTVYIPFDDEECTDSEYNLADRWGYAIIDESIKEQYVYERHVIKNTDNNEILKQGTEDKANVTICQDNPHITLEVYVKLDAPDETPPPGDDGRGGEREPTPTDEIATLPIDPPICDVHSNTITWTEKEQHSIWVGNQLQTCTHTYTYKAKLNVDSVKITPDTIKSGYGVDVDVETSVSYSQTGRTRSNSYCRSNLSSNRSPSSKPTPPTKVVARLGWTTNTFDGEFIQGSSVTLKRVSRNNTKSVFSAPYNTVVEESKLYTDIYLSGTHDVPRKHKIAFDIYGGGVGSTEWCTTVEKLITINGDMYEDDGTTST